MVAVVLRPVLCVIHRIRARILQSDALRGIAVLSGGTAVVQAISVALSPVFTRLYGPAAYGVFGVYNSMISVATAVLTGAYDQAILIEKSDRSARGVVTLCFAATAMSTVFCAIVLFTSGSRLFAALHATALTPIPAVVCIAVLLKGWSMSLSAWALRNRLFGLSSKTVICQNIVYNTVQLVCGALGAGAVGLVVGDVAGSVWQCSALTWHFWRHDHAWRLRVDAALVGSLARRYYRFPLLYMPSTLIGNIVVAIPLMWFASMYGARDAGLFSLAYKVIVVPLGLVTSSVAQVSRARLGQLAREDPSALRGYLRKTVRLLFCIVGPALGSVFIVGPGLFGLLFGTQWVAAGVYVRVLCPYMLLALCVSPLSNVLVVTERQGLHLVFDVARGCLIAMVFVLARVMNATPLVCVGLYSTAMCLAYLLMVWLIVYALRGIAGSDAEWR